MSEEQDSAMNIVNQFLQANLLASIGDDERRYESLKLTVHDLSESLSETPPKLIEFSRVAFQPAPNETNPVVEEVYTVLKNHWKLIDNVFKKGRPITVLRAIMLQVIADITEKDERLAFIIYHANISAFPHYRYGQGEITIIRSILEAAGETAEVYGLREFDKSERDVEEIPQIKISPPSKTEVDVALLQDGLVAAVGPQDAQGQAPKTSPVNSTWPNSGHQWSYQFPPIAAPAIASAIQGTLQSGLSTFATSASKSLNTSLQRFYEINQEVKGKLPRDLNILWWMQALYSPAIRRSYRDMDIVAAAFQMPHDLIAFDIVPCPESVVHILGEAARNATIDHSENRRSAAPLSDWLNQLHSSADKDLLRSTENHFGEAAHSASLLETSRVAIGASWDNNSQRFLGDLADASVTPRQLGMWLFRDLIAEQLAREL